MERKTVRPCFPVPGTKRASASRDHFSYRPVTTRFGSPSSMLMAGSIGETRVVVLSRHDRDHRITPTPVPNRANIQALKDQGCAHNLATTDVTIFDDFSDGLHHAPMADPFDPALRRILLRTAQELDIPVHAQGTVVTIEGPRFWMRAQNRMFRLLGGDVINMSTASECIIANELRIPYAAVAMSTDYDCWREDVEPVTWEAVLRIFRENAQKMTRLLVAAVPARSLR